MHVLKNDPVNEHVFTHLLITMKRQVTEPLGKSANTGNGK
jgi:hypothetical protein